MNYAVKHLFLTRSCKEDKSTFGDQLSRTRWLKFVLLTLAICHIALQLFVIVPTLYKRTDRSRDVVVYWRAAQHANNNEPLYGRYPVTGPDTFYRDYFYAPWFAAIISPLGQLPFVTFARLWLAFTIIAFWVFSWCLAKLSGKGSLYRTIVCGALLALFPGSYLTVGLGQMDPLLWAFFALGIIGIARPTLWCIAALVKPFYVWPLLAGKYRWKQLIPTIVLGVFLILLGGIICGWNSYLIWLHDILPSLTQGTFQWGNVSLSFAVLRLARSLGWYYVGGPLPPLAHLWLSAASFGAPLLAWIVTRKYPIQLKCAVIITVAMLFSPVCWTGYLSLSLPLLAILYRDYIAKSTFKFQINKVLPLP